MQMSISPEPIVGREVNLYIELMSNSIPAPNTVLTVTLPSGVELVTGGLNWRGDLAAGQPVEVDLTLRVTTAGEWPISAFAFSSVTPGSPYGFGAGKSLYVRSSINSAEVIEADKREKTPPPVMSGPELLQSTPVEP
jgi:hypothetical protein